ncbi:Piso0_000006 [Millerozyma farinosa CBS 7064]|uniref:Piso0_000006 protein n=1 Tax=Pichia sorbitophila (strain ATCC MYA-4447 / BCRC 22081 / CBS 7064 / NBRC 10061 / NRRL Y-12695) TaxID=559304 RepID=G8YUA5_PICSO|nr:Piso0_000006 [Millerozyma farinosa CBS 7064]
MSIVITESLSDCVQLRLLNIFLLATQSLCVLLKQKDGSVKEIDNHFANEILTSLGMLSNQFELLNRTATSEDGFQKRCGEECGGSCKKVNGKLCYACWCVPSCIEKRDSSAPDRGIEQLHKRTDMCPEGCPAKYRLDC